MSYYIIVFKNTLDAMNGEKAAKELDLNFRMMPTPTSITQSCGICVRVENLEDINKILEKENFTYKNIYLRENAQYTLFK